MEHLQRQQEAKLHLEREEKHLRQAQLAFAKHVAAARVSGAPLDSSFRGKSIDRTQTEQQQTADRYQSRAGVGYENEDDEQGSGGEDDEEDDDMDDEEHSEGEDALALNLKKPPLQQNSIFSFTPFSTSLPTDQPATSPPMTFKQEPEEKELSPLDQHSFTSPNGLTDWSFDEQFKQVSSTVLVIIVTLLLYWHTIGLCQMRQSLRMFFFEPSTSKRCFLPFFQTNRLERLLLKIIIASNGLQMQMAMAKMERNGTSFPSLPSLSRN